MMGPIAVWHGLYHLLGRSLLADIDFFYSIIQFSYLEVVFGLSLTIKIYKLATAILPTFKA